jgi:hypothetical protein
MTTTIPFVARFLFPQITKSGIDPSCARSPMQRTGAQTYRNLVSLKVDGTFKRMLKRTRESSGASKMLICDLIGRSIELLQEKPVCWIWSTTVLHDFSHEYQDSMLRSSICSSFGGSASFIASSDDDHPSTGSAVPRCKHFTFPSSTADETDQARATTAPPSIFSMSPISDQDNKGRMQKSCGRKHQGCEAQPLVCTGRAGRGDAGEQHLLADKKFNESAVLYGPMPSCCV